MSHKDKLSLIDNTNREISISRQTERGGEGPTPYDEQLAEKQRGSVLTLVRMIILQEAQDIKHYKPQENLGKKRE